jgi:acyl carrier protein
VSTTERSRQAPPDSAEVFALVRDALAVVLECDATTITSATSFAELEADSLALVEVAEIVEERLAERTGRHLRIPDGDLESFASVGDAVDYAVARVG